MWVDRPLRWTDQLGLTVILLLTIQTQKQTKMSGTTTDVTYEHSCSN